MKHLPIFLASNDKFAPFVATTIASFCANTKEFIDFYVLDSGISDINKQKIQNLKQTFKNFQLQFIKINCEERFACYPQLTHITKDMYSRFVIPEILPDCTKAVYSDIDVIAIGDIADLFETKMGDKILAAVPEYRVEAKEECLLTCKRLKLNKAHKPFNSGLLLINCAAWNKQNIDDGLFKVAGYLVNAQVLKYPDQDMLNKCFHKNYFELDKKYCIFPKHLNNNFTKEEINNLKKDGIILHYAGGLSKPWLNKRIPYADEFWKYALMTDFAKDITKIYHSFLIKHFCKKIIQTIFSIKNKSSSKRKQKVITILGIKIVI